MVNTLVEQARRAADPTTQMQMVGGVANHGASQRDTIAASVVEAGSFVELTFNFKCGNRGQQPAKQRTVVLHGFHDRTNKNMACNTLFIVEEVRARLTSIQPSQSKRYCRPSGDAQLVRHIAKATAQQLKILKEHGCTSSNAPLCNLLTL